jgi:hypothetical protein
MAVQGDNGKVIWGTDFTGPTEDTDITISDADSLVRDDVLVVAVSGDCTVNSLITEPNGVWTFSGAGAAADGAALIGPVSRPDRNGTMTVMWRGKVSTAADARFFLGFASTADRDETVNPFTLSGTTLTANNAGEAVGWYFDSQATTDQVRFMSSSAGVADTTAAVFNHQTGSLTTLGSLGIGATSMTLTADKYFMCKIEMDPDGTVRGYIGDETMSVKGMKLIATLSKGTMGTTSLYNPLCMMVAQTTGDPLWSCDFFNGNYNRYWGA